MTHTPESRPSETLTVAITEATKLESRRAFAEAATMIDEAIRLNKEAPASLRFKALLLRSDLAISLNDLGEGRGILAEAKQIKLSAQDRESLAVELRRADDLETFFTHRGCAG